MFLHRVVGYHRVGGVGGRRTRGFAGSVCLACIPQFMTLPLREVPHPQVQFPRQAANLVERFHTAVRFKLEGLAAEGD